MAKEHLRYAQSYADTSQLVAADRLTGIAIIYATLTRLELPLLGILVTTASIVYEDRLPLLSVGSISIHVPDVLLLASLGFIAVRWLVVPGVAMVRTPLDRPLLLFCGVTLLSTIFALFRSSVDVQEALRATRVLSYYLTFFIVTNLVRERRQLNYLVNCIFVLATIVAAAMIGQYVLGDSVTLLPGRVEALNTQGTSFESVTRIAPPGFSIVLVSFVTISCTLVLERARAIGLLRFFQCALMSLALVITFLRSYWAALFFVIILLAYLVRGDDRRRLIVWGAAGVFSAVVSLLVLSYDQDSRASKLLRGSWDRLSTLGISGTFQGQDGSVEWRKLENAYALSAIESSPVIGLGMGVIYRPWDSRLDSPDPNGVFHDFRRHIHNGHLWILLQSGLVGYLSLMWLSLAFLRRGFRYWRNVNDDRMRGVLLGFTLAYLAVLIAAVANSSFMQWRWTPVIGIMMGVNEAILRNARRDIPIA